jgi:hypothetical protein
MPEDIHRTLWKAIAGIVTAGKFAATAEIYAELTHINGDIGDCLKTNKAAVLLEVGDAAWDSIAYLGHAARMQVDHAEFISENNGNRKGTVGLNDLSIVALGLTLGIPVVSMETKLPSHAKSRRIPNVCGLEGVEHLDFSDFLRREQIVI